MFDNLTDKLTEIFQRLRGKGRLSEADVDEALRQVRLALLEADVNFRVARDFVARVREKAVGRDVLESISPGQLVVKIVHEELVATLSVGDHKLTSSPKPPSMVSAPAPPFRMSLPSPPSSQSSPAPARMVSLPPRP